MINHLQAWPAAMVQFRLRAGAPARPGIHPGISPDSEVAGRTRASRIPCEVISPGIFRNGAENSARGGRAPVPGSEFGLSTRASLTRTVPSAERCFACAQPAKFVFR
jgi:hypothetical protein